jgi:hypothetical protein
MGRGEENSPAAMLSGKWGEAATSAGSVIGKKSEESSPEEAER